MFNKVSKTFQYGQQTVTMETGEIARQASGAALGIIGIASYVGAGIQDIISGALLDKHKTVVDGITTHDYSVASVFWIAASVLSFLLVGVVWRKAAKNNRLKTVNCRK